MGTEARVEEPEPAQRETRAFRPGPEEAPAPAPAPAEGGQDETLAFRPPPAGAVAAQYAKLAAWYEAEYLKAVDLGAAEGGARFRRFAGGFPAGTRDQGDTPLSGRIRMFSFVRLRLDHPLGGAGYACAAMEAELEVEAGPGAGRGGEGPAPPAAALYAYAYWRRGAVRGPPEYVCLAPPFESQDGEYRPSFIQGGAFLAACEARAAPLAPLEEGLLALLAAGRLRLATRAYPPAEAAGVAAAADSWRLPVLALVAAVALAAADGGFGAEPPPPLAAHGAFLGALAREAPGLAAAACRLEAEGETLDVFRRGHAHSLAVQCGQKLVPLFLREAAQARDVNLAAWREQAVMQLAADLVLNYVTPSFALYNQWTYVEGADAALFESAAMRARYARARLVASASRALRKARRRAGAAPPNAHTADLREQVGDSLEYARSFLLLSPVALLHTAEHVGWTLGALPDRVRRAPWAPWPAAEGAFATPDAAARHLFELAYAAHCLHAKAGAAHTDIHADNLTLYLWGYDPLWRPGGPASPSYADPVVVYAAGPRGEADAYVFPAAGDSACLIDFSRSVLGPAFGARLERAGRGGRYAANFFRDQAGRVLRALHRHAPEFVEAHQDALWAAVRARHEEVFPVLCAADFMAIGRAVGGVLASALGRAPRPGERPFRVAPEGLELARRLEAAGRELLAEGLEALVRKGPPPAGGRGAAPRPLPGGGLLPRLFDAWRFPVWAAREPGRVRSAEVVDAYSFANEPRWEGGDYARWPPWARLDEIEARLGGVRFSDLFGWDRPGEWTYSPFSGGFGPFLEALLPSRRADQVAEELRAEEAALDAAEGAPPPAPAEARWDD